MGKLKSWYGTVQGRLAIAAFVPVVSLLIVGAISEFQSVQLGHMLKESYDTIIPNLKSMSEMLYYRGNVGLYAGSALNQTDPAKRKATVEAGHEAYKSYLNAKKSYEDAPNIEGEDELYKVVRDRQDHFAKATTDLFALLEKQTPEADKEALGLLYGSWLEEAKHIRVNMEKILTKYSKYSSEQDVEQEKARTRANWIMISSAVGFSILVLAYLYMVSRAVSGKVIEASQGLTQASSQLSAATQALSNAGSSLSSSSAGAAASLQETVASLEELTSMVNTNSDHAKEAAKLSQSSCEIAEQGETEIKKLIESMTDISQSSRKIEEIINVIDDIAFQTNLLALNAAVEAARAGEQGKGFAVVAEAVRALAMRSASAAKDISSLIKESVQKIDQGTAVAGKSGDVLSSIVDSVKKVSNLNGEISTASEEQTRGINQISKAMNQLDQISQTNAASSEEIAATSTDISEQTQNMVGFVYLLNELSGVKSDDSSKAA